MATNKQLNPEDEVLVLEVGYNSILLPANTLAESILGMVDVPLLGKTYKEGRYTFFTAGPERSKLTRVIAGDIDGLFPATVTDSADDASGD